MSKFLSLVKNKKGAVLMTAIAFMTIVVALCGIVTTFILAMSKTTASYTSVNENKIVADSIAADYLDYKNNNISISSYTDFSNYVSGEYTGYTASTTDSDTNATEYTCIAYEESSTSPLITVTVEEDANNSNTYKFTKYEYGNI